MSKSIFVTLIFAFTIIASISKTSSSNHNDANVIIINSRKIENICLNRSPGLGFGPFFTLFITDKGKIFYQNWNEHEYNDTDPLKGIYEGDIEHDTFIKISSILFENDFFNQKFMGLPVDLPTTTIEVSTDLITKSFEGWDKDINENMNLKAIVNSIENLKNEIKWQPIKDERVGWNKIHWCGIRIHEKSKD